MLVIVKRVALVLAILITIAMLWSVTIGHEWVGNKIGDVVVHNYVAFPTPRDKPPVSASITVTAGSLQTCNRDQFPWTAGLVQVNDNYFAYMSKTAPGACQTLNSFTSKDFKRIPFGGPIYKVQVSLGELDVRYSEFAVVSTRIEHVAGDLPPQCLPVAIERPVVDWRYVRASHENAIRQIQIQYKITAKGTVKNPTVTSSGGSEELDNAALAVVNRWKYKPAPGCGDRLADVYLDVDSGALL